MKQRILFVDDNQWVLTLFRRVLPFMQKDWIASYAMNGKEGLAILEQGPVDVVVSDIAMPEMDGIAFLREVERKYPHTVRLVFCDDSGHGAGLHLAKTAHQFFRKPDDFNAIKMAVERVQKLFRMLPEGNLRVIAGQIGALPTLPELYHKVTAELDETEPSVERIGRLIGQDIAMSAKLLQVVNSAFFGLRQRVANPTQAVSMLGLTVVRSLILMLHVLQEHEEVRVDGLTLKSLWRHSLSVAEMAREIVIAEHMDQDLVDHSCSAGLFHDIGKVVLMINFPELYAKAFEAARVHRADLSQMELEFMGASHSQVGAYLLGIWGFSDIFVNTCLFHHTPSSSGEMKLGPLTAVHTANVFDHSIEPPESGEKPVALDDSYMKTLGINSRVSDWRRNCLEENESSV